MRDDLWIPPAVTELLGRRDQVVAAYERRRDGGLPAPAAIRGAVLDVFGRDDGARLLGALPAQFCDEFCAWWEPRRSAARSARSAGATIAPSPSARSERPRERHRRGRRDGLLAVAASCAVLAAGAIAAHALRQSVATAPPAFAVDAGEAVLVPQGAGQPRICTQLSVRRIREDASSTVPATAFFMLASDGVPRGITTLDDSSTWRVRHGDDLAPSPEVGAQASYVACFTTPTAHGTFELRYTPPDRPGATWGYAFP